MKLFLIAGCPFAHRASMVLREKHVELEPVFFEGKARPPELEALGPNAKSPTVKDGDEAVWDSQIVIEYLDERFPSPSLSPKDAFGRATMRMLMTSAEKELGAKQGVLVHELVLKPKDERDPAKVEATKRELLALLPAWNARVEPGPFLLGEQLTLADVTLYSILAAVGRVGDVRIPDELGALVRWYARIDERPSAPMLQKR